MDAPTTFREATERLAETLPGYEARPQQVRLATAIEDAWAADEILVGQALTGCGKSLAGLIPAILSGKRTVYSTATKALQAQLTGKDLPFLEANLGVPFKYAMLQGRANYACELLMMDNGPSQPVIAANFKAFMDDDDEHPNGNFELSGLREELPQPVDNISWSKMSMSAELCPRKKCPFYRTCRFEHARAKALAADMVVANHALVALDGVISDQSEGRANILGQYEHLIIDECHALQDFVTMALTSSSSIGTYEALSKEMIGLFREIGSDDQSKDIEAMSRDLIVEAQVFFDTFPAGRVKHSAAIAESAVVERMLQLLTAIKGILDEAVEDVVFEQATEARVGRTDSRLRNLIAALRNFLLSRDSAVVRVFEPELRGQRSVKVLKIIPVSIASWAQANLWSRVTPTLMSATVLVDGSADFVSDQLGLDRSRMRVVDVGSPFDFARQSRLYIPAHITEPTPAKREQWEREMLPLLEELVMISSGRALLLFTSNKQLETAYAKFAHKLPYPTRKQGDGSAALLTNWFRDEIHSVLFATRTFFQGIDISGESLSLLVVDKLPFNSPVDPLFEARSEDVERRGGSSFNDLSIPMVTLVLQQACGRLIRSKSDLGVMAILDPRLMTKKSYGGKIRRSLPVPVITDLGQVEEFFASIDSQSKGEINV